MENLISILSVLAAFTQVENNLPKEFAINVDDRGQLYLKSLIEMMKKNISVNNNTVKKVKYGDIIVFADNDVTREDNYREVVRRGIPILSLVTEYDKVEKAVKNFFKNVYKPVKINPCVGCPMFGLCAELQKAESKSNIIYNGEYISVDEKVSIFYNFVKVGYDQYDIYEVFGSKFVDIEDEVFQVKTDRCGKKFLELVK